MSKESTSEPKLSQFPFSKKSINQSNIGIIRKSSMRSIHSIIIKSHPSQKLYQSIHDTLHRRKSYKKKFSSQKILIQS